MVKKYSVKVFVILAVVMMLMILGNLSCFMVDVQKMKFKKKIHCKTSKNTARETNLNAFFCNEAALLVCYRP